MSVEHMQGEISAGSPLGKIVQECFRFDHLHIEGIDNSPVFERHGAGLQKEEFCLFHESMSSGDAYVAQLATRIEASLENHTSLPVVRFADGEYAFYSGSLKCNGLYKQAESVAAIKAAFPAHAEALRYLAATGILAPLIFPGNTRERSWLRKLLGKKDGKDLAIRFLQFLADHLIRITETNYIPF